MLQPISVIEVAELINDGLNVSNGFMHLTVLLVLVNNLQELCPYLRPEGEYNFYFLTNII